MPTSIGYTTSTACTGSAWIHLPSVPEIGARPHYFKTNHQNEHDFEKQMRTTFELLFQVMKPRAKACFLVGRSIIHGRVIDNVALLERAAEGYFGPAVLCRDLSERRARHSTWHTQKSTQSISSSSLADRRGCSIFYWHAYNFPCEQLAQREVSSLWATRRRQG